VLASYNHVFPLPLTIHPLPIISGSGTYSNHIPVGWGVSWKLGCVIIYIYIYIYIYVCVCVCITIIVRDDDGWYKSLNDSARDQDVRSCVVCCSASIKFGRPMDSIMPFTLQQMCGKRGGLMHSTVNYYNL